MSTFCSAFAREFHFSAHEETLVPAGVAQKDPRLGLAVQFLPVIGEYERSTSTMLHFAQTERIFHTAYCCAQSENLSF